MGIDLSKINLRKNAVIDLKKRHQIADQKAAVKVVADFSGSMRSLYNNGAVQETFERLLPLGLAFDDDGEVDAYLFHDDVIVLDEKINLYNVGDYVNKNIIGKYQMGATSYAPPINQILREVKGSAGLVSQVGGFLGFGTKTTLKLDYPVYVIFITDGENSDKSETKRALIEASNYGIFFQFVGIGNERFTFLNELDNLSGRLIDNANFFKVPDLTRTPDEELYGLLLNEFPSWTKLARSNNLIK